MYHVDRDEDESMISSNQQLESQPQPPSIRRHTGSEFEHKENKEENITAIEHSYYLPWWSANYQDKIYACTSQYLYNLHGSIRPSPAIIHTHNKQSLLKFHSIPHLF